MAKSFTPFFPIAGGRPAPQQQVQQQRPQGLSPEQIILLLLQQQFAEKDRAGERRELASERDLQRELQEKRLSFEREGSNVEQQLAELRTGEVERGVVRDRFNIAFRNFERDALGPLRRQKAVLLRDLADEIVANKEKAIKRTDFFVRQVRKIDSEQQAVELFRSSLGMIRNLVRESGNEFDASVAVSETMQALAQLQERFAGSERVQEAARDAGDSLFDLERKFIGKDVQFAERLFQNAEVRIDNLIDGAFTQASAETDKIRDQFFLGDMSSDAAFGTLTRKLTNVRKGVTLPSVEDLVGGPAEKFVPPELPEIEPTSAPTTAEGRVRERTSEDLRERAEVAGERAVTTGKLLETSAAEAQFGSPLSALSNLAGAAVSKVGEVTPFVRPAADEFLRNALGNFPPGDIHQESAFDPGSIFPAEPGSASEFQATRLDQSINNQVLDLTRLEDEEERRLQELQSRELLESLIGASSSFGGIF